MIFQCGDPEHSLRHPELMPEARAHAQQCEPCREQLSLWEEISRVAPQLHEEWDTESLWPRIHRSLTAERLPRSRPLLLQWAVAVAAMVTLAVVLLAPRQGERPARRDLLTDAALSEVQRAEADYARSIDRLAAMAVPAIRQSASPIAAAYREKLTLLDSAITDVKSNVEQNRYNAYLRTELASMYGEKQKTLREWMEYAKRN